MPPFLFSTATQEMEPYWLLSLTRLLLSVVGGGWQNLFSPIQEGNGNFIIGSRQLKLSDYLNSSVNWEKRESPSVAGFFPSGFGTRMALRERISLQHPLVCCVPQGAILSLMLFNIYMCCLFPNWFGDLGWVIISMWKTPSHICEWTASHTLSLMSWQKCWTQ